MSNMLTEVRIFYLSVCGLRDQKEEMRVTEMGRKRSCNWERHWGDFYGQTEFSVLAA